MLSTSCHRSDRCSSFLHHIHLFYVIYGYFQVLSHPSHLHNLWILLSAFIDVHMALHTAGKLCYNNPHTHVANQERSEAMLRRMIRWLVALALALLVGLGLALGNGGAAVRGGAEPNPAPPPIPTKGPPGGGGGR